MRCYHSLQLAQRERERERERERVSVHIKVIAICHHSHRFGRYLEPPSAEPQLCNAPAKLTRRFQLTSEKESVPNGPW